MKHIFVIIFIILLIWVVRLILKKGELHFKILKELYPDKFRRINSSYNPLFVIYIFGLDINIILWYYSPIYFEKKSLIINTNEKLIFINNRLLKNNRIIYLLVVIMLIWLIFGGYLLSR